MANKKVSQLTSKPSVLVTDLFPIADPSTGQLYKTTISDLGTAIGSGVSSVNGLVGAVVLDTDDIQELVSPTNKWFTDTRARAALSASSPLAYNSGTGVFSIPAATSSQNGYLTSTDWSTFNGKLDPSTAASTYIPYTGATGGLNLGAFNLLVNGITVGIGSGTGSHNTAVGFNVLNASTTSADNTAVGYSSMPLIVGGSTNTAIGAHTLESNVSGSGNVAIGWSNLITATGSNNTSVGQSSGGDLTSGEGNTFLGYDTGRGITTGSYNTILGNSVTLGTSISNNIVLADGQGNIKYRWDGTNNNLFGNLFLQANNTVAGTNYYIGQQMATNDYWRIYGNTVASDQGEMVFHLGDNGTSWSSSGQRFRFFVDNDATGTAKSLFTLDYDTANFATNLIANGTMQLANDGTYGSNYKMLAFTGNTNGYHRIFAGTADNLYLASATGRDIVFWTDGSSITKASISTTGAATFASTVATTGVIFPATQIASANPNTLDDYEEGTFTPTIAGSTTAGTVSYSSRNGVYTKIGNVVHFRVDVIWSSHTGTGQITITGFPFTVAQQYMSVGNVRFDKAITALNYLGGHYIFNSTIYIEQMPVGGGAPSGAPIVATGDLRISGFYIV